ncbi:exonuclease SbcC [Chitinophaga dinghuensis]|uniref:Exonuclease SbcC n=1 Tax=Chitinophaga dinghuensis TaxID=1539050 RepID=A0A327VVM6_9BACT|nr:AAA family ATPase [Chitinophaga dinghuensis]RAJ80051.1 exonuclease SbcC [Chitinophaga dinghuensis]
MKIRAIRIKNLASLEGTVEIDFTQAPLQQAGIFAITGPTGAGKSTILDALCLALYAKTPRYKQAESGVEVQDVQGATINQSDIRGILRDGTADGYAEVDFVGVDGQPYRATWSVRRARNKADGALQAYEIALKNIHTNAAVPGKKGELQEEIARLVGLNFEQFTRSVLLAQGDFTAFLKAGRDEKASLLEKLTGTTIYTEISQRIFRRSADQQLVVKALTAKQEGISTLTTAELEALQQEKASLQTAIQSTEQRIETLTREIDWHERLATLMESQEAAQQAYDTATAEVQHAAPREQQLEQVAKVQPLRATVEALQTTQKQLNDKTQEATSLMGQLDSLLQQKVSLQTILLELQQQLDKAVQEQESAQPKLIEARALDVQLKEKQEQIRQATAQRDEARKRLQQQEEELSQKNTAAENLAASITALTKWKTDNVSRQPIAEQQEFILSVLHNAGVKVADLDRYAVELASIKDLIQSGKTRLVALKSTQADLQATCQQEQTAYQQASSQLQTTDVIRLEEEKNQIDLAVEDILRAEAQWKLLYHSRQETDTLQQQLQEQREALTKVESELQLAATAMTLAKAQKDVALSARDKARVAAAADVEKLREQLTPEEPCPVCGSKEHPYATHDPRLSNLLAELESDYNAAEKEYTNCLTTHSGLQKSRDLIVVTIATKDKEVQAKEAAIAAQQLSWTTFQIYPACMQQPETERAAWLLARLEATKLQQTTLKEKIHLYQTSKAKLDKAKEQLDKQEKELSDKTNAIKDEERALTSQEEKLTMLKESISAAEAALEQVQQQLSVHFASPQWFQGWKQNPESFVAKIQEFAAAWKSQIAQLEENTRKQAVLEESITGSQAQVVYYTEDASQKQEQLVHLELAAAALQSARKAIFDGKPVAAVEADLKAAADYARQNQDGKKAELDVLLAEETRVGARKEQAEKDQESLQQQTLELQHKITQWLNQYNQQQHTNLSEPALHQLLSFPPEWMDTERAALRRIADVQTQAKSVLEERTTAWNTHRQQHFSENTLENLKESKLVETEVLRQKGKEFNGIEFKLKQDEENKDRIGTLREEIATQTQIWENWQKLNEIIGSADGKKFRQIAQEYTLDALLSHANVHLEFLNQRYVLERIPNSLGLQVLDKDMGNEIRTVYSLSGGESFLVSLALALGLASLSSSRMKVESLFIDEGFGSLDPATLNIAMDALERLHNQGRKVGVISHVQEMTERIPVQIKVSKMQSGKSKVAITGI